MVSDRILVQTQEMLEQNVGYNVSPENWFTDYPAIGPRGTYITNNTAISSVIGEFEGSTTIKITKIQALHLEASLGLKPGSLADGFRISKIMGINEMDLSYPVGGNDYFLGAGKGLPGGGPELKINPSLPIDSPQIVEQIIVEVMP